jgi:PTS system nitrogen regulatory IIA component
MHEYQLTFQVSTNTEKAVVIHLLPALAKKFKSTLHIINITRNRIASLHESVAVLQAGLVKGDVCQISAIGIDAQLACFVIKNVIDKYYVPIASASDLGFSNELSKKVPQLGPQCPIHWSNLQLDDVTNKDECLHILAKLIDPDGGKTAYNAFCERESHSPSIAVPGIALPHILLEHASTMKVAVLRTKTNISWTPNNQDTQLIIAFVLPDTTNRQHVIAASNLARNLSNAMFAERLLVTQHSIELQALLMHSMTRLF